MARIGFLSHESMSLYFFRAPIMRALKERGHEIYAIAPAGDYTQKLASEFHAATYELDKASINPFRVLKNSEDLAAVLRDLNLDMLQTSAHKSNVFGTFAAKKAGIKTVLNLVEGLGSFYVDSDVKSLLIRAVIERLYKRSLTLSDGCIFVNDADPDYFLAKGLSREDKIYRIKSVGVDASYFDPNACEGADLGERKVVLMMGRALWHKGIKEFYEAAELLKDRTDASFVFVGSGYAGNKSSADEAFLKSPFVRWIPWSEQVRGLYKSAYMFVLPSYKEGFPHTVLEAMSMARACVVSDCSGCVEAVQDGVNGLICRTRDANDLARKIEILLDDEPLCERLGRNGRETVLANYDEKIVTEKYLEVYRKFIDV